MSKHVPNSTDITGTYDTSGFAAPSLAAIAPVFRRDQETIAAELAEAGTRDLLVDQDATGPDTQDPAKEHSQVTDTTAVMAAAQPRVHPPFTEHPGDLDLSTLAAGVAAQNVDSQVVHDVEQTAGDHGDHNPEEEADPGEEDVDKHDPNGEMSEGDDPGDFNVGPVNAYLNSLDEESEEYQRVLDEEAAGKNRASIVGG